MTEDRSQSSLGPEAEDFSPAPDDLFMMTFRPRRSGLDGRVFTDGSYFECIFRALDVDNRLVIAKMVAGTDCSRGKPYVFNRDQVNFYRCSEERLALFTATTDVSAAQSQGSEAAGPQSEETR